MASCTSTRYILYFVWFLKFSGCQCESTIPCYVFLYNSQKNSLENITTEVCQNWDFSYHTCICMHDFQAKLGGSQRDQGGWTVCSLPVLLTSFELASPIKVCFFSPFFHLMFRKTVYMQTEHQIIFKCLMYFFQGF